MTDGRSDPIRCLAPSKGNFIKYSIAVNPEAYQDEEYFCLFTPRVHKDNHLANKGCWDCQVDYLGSSSLERANAQRNENHKSYAVGCINPRVGNFTALCACECIPERLELISYMIEYAYIHDDVIEYAENKSMEELQKRNRDLMEGLDESLKPGAKENSHLRELQAKMAEKLLKIDPVKGASILRLWKQMSDVFVKIRDLKWSSLDDYLAFRAVDAGCPWTMAILCFGTDFTLSEKEDKSVSEVTTAAFYAWCLVNDYFSFEKEWQNFEANNKEGNIVSAVFLYMKWFDADAPKAKKMVRGEIKAREQRFVELKAAWIANNTLTENIKNWFTILDMVTAGNFAWSMTTARYHLDAADAYPDLRAAYYGKAGKESPNGPASGMGHNRAVGGKEASNKPVISDSHEHRSTNTHNEGSHDMEAQVASNVATSPSLSGHMTRVVEDDSSHSSSTANSNGGTRLLSPLLDNPEKMERGDYFLEISPISSFEAVVLEPYAYIKSLPSKEVRNSVLEGLDVWYQVPKQSSDTIRSIVNALHEYSLMMDDVQDGSEMRRGSPCAHTVFSTSRTINAASLLIIKAIQTAASLSPDSVRILTDRLVQGHIGQGMDLYWTQQSFVPTEAEYFCMVDGKTGALFSLLADLMRSASTVNKNIDITWPMTLFGRLFQARDDYRNLADDEYTRQKGTADDIIEGKLSLPLIYALRSDSHRGRLMSILQQRKGGTRLSPCTVDLALRDIEQSGGLDFCRTTIAKLQKAVRMALDDIEAQTGVDNQILRSLLGRLDTEA